MSFAEDLKNTEVQELGKVPLNQRLKQGFAFVQYYDEEDSEEFYYDLPEEDE